MTTSRSEARALTLRAATLGDFETTLRWANDHVTRSVSFNQEPLTHDRHRRWLEAALEDPARHLFIAMSGNAEVAFIRLENDGTPRVAVVSINVAPEHRGRGLGSAVLQATTVVARELGVETIVAWIKSTNAASVRAFARAGYRPANRPPDAEAPGDRYELNTAGSEGS